MSQGTTTIAVSDRKNKLGKLIISFRLWVNYFLRKWWIILISALIGGAIGVTISTLEKPKYQSKLTFSLEESDGGVGGVINLAAELGLNFGAGGGKIFSGDNILTILTSRRIIEQVLLSVDTVNEVPKTMIDYFIEINSKETNKEKHKAIFPVGLSKKKYTYYQDSVLFTIFEGIQKGSLIVSRPDKKLNLYQIQVTSANERFSKVFTERLIEATTSFYVEMKSRRTRQTLEILETRANSMRGAARQSIQSKAYLTDININPAQSMQSARLQDKQLDINAYSGAYAEIFKNLEVARYQYLQNIPLLTIIDEPNYPLKKIKSGRLRTGLIMGFLVAFLTIVVLFTIRFFKLALKDT